MDKALWVVVVALSVWTLAASLAIVGRDSLRMPALCVAWVLLTASALVGVLMAYHGVVGRLWLAVWTCLLGSAAAVLWLSLKLDRLRKS